MIEVHRLNGEAFFLNHNMIETMEEKPDTILRLNNDKTLILKDSITDIISKIIIFNREIFNEKNRTN